MSIVYVNPPDTLYLSLYKHESKDLW